MKAILNGRVIVPDAQGDFCVLEHMAVVYDERIAEIMSMQEMQAAAGVTEVFDAAGRYVAPGFLNVHVHGCLGRDTMDDDAEALPVISRCQASMGVTAYLPTTMTYDFTTICRALDHVREAMGS